MCWCPSGATGYQCGGSGGSGECLMPLNQRVLHNSVNLVKAVPMLMDVRYR